MKKLFLFFSIIAVFLISAIFAIPTINDVSATEWENTYSYISEIVTDYDTTFLNGIDSVESVSFDYNTWFDYKYTGSFDITIEISSTQTLNFFSTSSSYYFDAICFKLNRYNYVDFDAYYFSCSLMLRGSFYLNSYTNGVLNIYYIYGTCNRVIFTDISIYDNGGGNISNYISDDNYANTYYSSRSYYSDDEDLSYYLDLNSATNYEYNIENVLSDYLLTYSTYSENIFDYLTNVLNSNVGTHTFFSGNFPSNSPFEFKVIKGSSDVWTLVNTDIFNYTLSTTYYSTIPNYCPTDVDISNGLYVYNYTVQVRKPVYRTENTLVIYNYDYDCAISSISSVEYALSKGSELYKAKYTGSLPNSKIIGFTCDELQNRLYDEYIYIYLTFNNNLVDCSTTGNFSFGFDFNFSRYYEPLVIEDTDFYGSNYFPDLTKPNGNILTNFGGWIKYAFIWCFFYNPIIAPITKVFIPFIDLLVGVCKFLIGLPLGQFVFAYIGFMVFYKVVASLMPNGGMGAIVDIGSATLDYTSDVYDSRQKKRDAKYISKKKMIKLRKKSNKINKRLQPYRRKVKLHQNRSKVENQNLSKYLGNITVVDG